jgi:hypothetical protein
MPSIDTQQVSPNPTLDALVITDYQSEEEQRISALISTPALASGCDDCESDARYMVEPPPSNGRRYLYSGWAFACQRHMEVIRYRMAIRVIESQL